MKLILFNQVLLLLVQILSCSSSNPHNERDVHAADIDATQTLGDVTISADDSYRVYADVELPNDTSTAQSDVNLGANDANSVPADVELANDGSTAQADMSWDAAIEDCGLASTANVCAEIAQRFGTLITPLIAEYRACTTDSDCMLLTPVLSCSGPEWHIRIESCPVFVNQSGLTQIASSIDAHKDELCITPCPRESCVVMPSCIGSEVADCSDGRCL